jgi:hypothetical protein
MAKASRLTQASAFARKLLDDAMYQEQLKIRLMDGSLPSNIEALLYHYAYGKPVESVEVTDNRDIERMSDDELMAVEKVLRSREAGATVN